MEKNKNSDSINLLSTPTYIACSAEELKDQIRRDGTNNNSIEILVKRGDLRVMAKRIYNRQLTPEEARNEYIAMDREQLTPALQACGIDPKEIDLITKEPKVEVYLSEPFTQLPEHLSTKYPTLSNILA